MNGKVIGVNTAIYSPSGGSVGIGFDVPAQTAKMVVAQLKEKWKGYVRLAWRPDSARNQGDCRQLRLEEGRRRDGRRAAERKPRGKGGHAAR